MGYCHSPGKTILNNVFPVAASSFSVFFLNLVN